MTEITSAIITLLIKLTNDLLPRRILTESDRGFWPADYWSALEDSGITKSSLPESDGGASMTLYELAPVVKLTGALALPVPLAEHLVASCVCMSIGLEIPTSGILTIASPIEHDSRLTETRSGGALYVDGNLEGVPWGNRADFVIAALDNKTIVLIPSGESTRLTYNLADEPRVAYKYQHMKCIAAAECADAERRLHAEGAFMRSIQLVGAMERVLELTLGYAETRSQFNKPLIRMQVIQQMLARLAGQVAAANAAVAIATEALTGQDSDFFAGAGKSRASEGAGIVAALAHQIHGAIGFTREYELQLYSRRLWAWRDEFGNENYWNASLTSRVASGPPERLWSLVTENDHYEA